MSYKSLSCNGSNPFAVCVPNPYVSSSFLYPLGDFTFQAWVKTTHGGMVASNAYVPPTSGGHCTQTTSYGYFTVKINGDGSLTFNLTYNKYMPYDPTTGISTNPAFPFYSFVCNLQSATSFARGEDKSHIRLLDGGWHRIDAVRSAYVLRLYVDGFLVATQSFVDVFTAGPVPFEVDDPISGPTVLNPPALTPQSITTAAAPLYWGWDPIASGGNHSIDVFGGNLDEVRLWGQAMSPTDLQLLADMTPPPTAPHLLGRWALDSDSSAVPIDATGRNTQCTYTHSGTAPLSDPGFAPPTPQYLCLSGSAAAFYVADGSQYKFAGDFTVEAWICPDPGQYGPVVSRLTDTDGGWALVTEPNGSISIYCQSSTHTTRQQSRSGGIFDGNWHHVAYVRQGTTQTLYIDGKPMGSHTSSSSLAPMNMSMSNHVGIMVGATTYTGNFGNSADPYHQSPTGAFDEVRVWNRALSVADLAAGMFHGVDSTDHSLVGWWQFDHKDGRDSSAYNNTVYKTNGDSYPDAPFDYTPLGTPYVLTQSCLMQEYVPNQTNNDGSPKETSTYRVMLSGRDGSDGARPTLFTVWATEVVTLRVGSQTFTTGPNQPLDFSSDAHGQLRLTLSAKLSDSSQSQNDRLYCPGIYVRADFMSQDERIFVSPDREFHAKLAQVKGSQLTAGVGGGPSLFAAGTLSSTEANSVASAINDVMTAASHSGVQTSTENTTDFAVMKQQRTTMSVSMARDAEAMDAGLPTQPLYVSRKVPVVSVNMPNRLVKSHYLPQPVAVTRVAGAAYRSHAVTQFNYATKTFSAVTSDDVQTRVARCASFIAVPRTQAQATEFAASSASSWWSDFVDGVLDVVDSVVETVEDAAHTLQTTIIHLVDGVEQAFQWIIDSVESAADYLKGMLATLGVVATQVIDFARSLFQWDQYRPTYDLLMSYSEQIYEVLRDALVGVNTLIDAQIDSWKNTIDDAINTLLGKSEIQNATLQSGGASALVQPSGDVQSDYLGSLVSDNVSDYTQSVPGGSVANEGNLPTVPDITQQDAYSGFMQNVQDSRGVMQLAVSDMLQALKDLVDFVLDAVKTVVDGVFTLVEGVLLGAWEVMNETLPNIPILTSLFTAQLGVAWTPRSLFCMMGAVAANLAYKTGTLNPNAQLADDTTVSKINGGQIYAQISAVLTQLGIPMSGSSTSFAVVPQSKSVTTATLVPVDSQTLVIVSYAASAAYSCATVVWGVGAFICDLSTYESVFPRTQLTSTYYPDAGRTLNKVTELPPIGACTGLKITAEFLATTTAFPLMVLTTPLSDPRVGAELALFGAFGLGFLTDLVAWPVNPSGGSVVAKVFQGAATLIGVGALAATGVVCAFDFVYGKMAADQAVMKLTQNICGSLTLVAQGCFLYPIAAPGGEYVQGVPLLADGVCYPGNALINALRLFGDISTNVLDEVR